MTRGGFVGKALLVAIIAAPAFAQIPPRDVGGSEAHTKVPQPSAMQPDLQSEHLLEQAQDLHQRANDMRSQADDLRDINKDTEADSLEQRADGLDDRANHLERQAKQVELSGGSHPERVQIPDLP